MFKKIGKLLYNLVHLNRWVFVIFAQNKRLDDIEATLRQYEILHEKLNQQEEKLNQQEEKLQSMDNLIQTAVAKQIFYHAMGMHQRIDQFLFDLKQENTPIDKTMQENINHSKNIFLDNYYLSFENNFRGSRESIIQRYVPYLSYFNLEKIHTALDIGCGRGEWVELLQSHGIETKGIDTNHAMIDLCQAHNISSVTCNNALTYLSQCPENSFDLITAFHLIEHLDMETLLSLFTSIRHVLKPDGILIVETPNPDNLLVSSLMFYNDLTHRNPIPKEVTQFMIEHIGFKNINVMPLHPFPKEMYFQENSDVARVLNERMFGAQDYLIIAQKQNESY